MTAKMTAINSSCDGCLRLEEADHRIANHLALLGGYVRLKSAKLVRQNALPPMDDAVLLLKAIGVQIEAMSQLHRFLATTFKPNSVELHTYLASICATLRSAVAEGVQIIEEFDPGCVLSPDHMLPVAQIVTEVITNAIKHGQSKSSRAIIRVSCQTDDQGSIRIEVRDNGPGLPEPTPATGTHGLGVRIIESLVAQVHGRIDYLSGRHGLTVRLTLPDVAQNKPLVATVLSVAAIKPFHQSPAG